MRHLSVGVFVCCWWWHGEGVLVHLRLSGVNRGAAEVCGWDVKLWTGSLDVDAAAHLTYILGLPVTFKAFRAAEGWLSVGGGGGWLVVVVVVVVV